MSTTNGTAVMPVVHVRESYVNRSALFGLIRWHEVLKTEVLGRILVVETPHDLSEIRVNGTKYVREALCSLKADTVQE